MIITWALVFSICYGGTCDDYVMDHLDTPTECLEKAVKYTNDLSTEFQYAISCEKTYIEKE